jgi:hypothetical protein
MQESPQLANAPGEAQLTWLINSTEKKKKKNKERKKEKNKKKKKKERNKTLNCWTEIYSSNIRKQ